MYNHIDLESYVRLFFSEPDKEDPKIDLDSIIQMLDRCIQTTNWNSDFKVDRRLLVIALRNNGFKVAGDYCNIQWKDIFNLYTCAEPGTEDEVNKLISEDEELFKVISFEKRKFIELGLNDDCSYIVQESGLKKTFTWKDHTFSIGFEKNELFTTSLLVVRKISFVPALYPEPQNPKPYTTLINTFYIRI